MIDTSKLRRIEDCKGRLTRKIGDEKILQLTKEGVIPHFVLTDPVSKEESYLFVSSEVEEWLKDNHLKYNEGVFEKQYDFVKFDDYLHREIDVLKIPKELSLIKELKQLPMKTMITPPGVYFLCKDREIVYVGKSVNVANRVMTHITEKVKDFDSAFYIHVPILSLDRIENALIRTYRPKYNNGSIPESTKLDEAVMRTLR